MEQKEFIASFDIADRVEIRLSFIKGQRGTNLELRVYEGDEAGPWLSFPAVHVGRLVESARKAQEIYYKRHGSPDYRRR